MSRDLCEVTEWASADLEEENHRQKQQSAKILRWERTWHGKGTSGRPV